MRRTLLNKTRASRTWPKFIGAVCLFAAVIIADGYAGLVWAITYLLAAAVLLQGLPKRYAVGTAAISFFAAAALFFGYVKIGEPTRVTLILPVKILTLAWVSAYFYTITPPTALVNFFARMGRPLRHIGVMTGFWSASLGFAVSALPGTRRTTTETVTAVRLRSPSTLKIGRRLKMAGLATANILTGVFEEAFIRADAAALRGGTVEAAAARRDDKPIGPTTIFGPVLVLIATITVKMLW
jgi:energy-coupling factor transporter transmembrane protein EcfT